MPSFWNNAQLFWKEFQSRFYFGACAWREDKTAFFVSSVESWTQSISNIIKTTAPSIVSWIHFTMKNSHDFLLLFWSDLLCDLSHFESEYNLAMWCQQNNEWILWLKYKDTFQHLRGTFKKTRNERMTNKITKERKNGMEWNSV